LRLHAVDELGAVAAANSERLTRGRKMPPSTRSSGRLSLYRFASITQTPEGPMAMWSMFASCRGCGGRA
jgi:hypothetical protein